MSEQTRCRSCNAEIVWAVTKRGKRAPVDKRPDHRGDFLLIRTSGELRLVHQATATFEQLAEHGPDRYVTHFATCPAADRHRRAS